MDSLNYVDQLGLKAEAREGLWKSLVDVIEFYLRSIEDLRVSPEHDFVRVREFVESFRFEQAILPEDAFRIVASELIRSQVHTSHPMYFGLFTPAPTTMSIAADALVATMNPQLATWSHSPLAVEIERHIVLSLAEKFGLRRDQADGVFTTGGAESNHTALLAALSSRWPEVASCGLRGLKEQPVFYVSTEGHDSFLKAARSTGLGANSVRKVQVRDDLCMDCSALRVLINKDLASGFAPFLVVATAGTTSAGMIDPLAEIACLAREYGLWYHVDAAWGGAALLLTEMRGRFDGIKLADSITFDAHKWLSVSMGAGIFLTRHTEILSRCFTTQTTYMPKGQEVLQVIEPYAHSLQWSRRFIGLKLFLSLAVAGWDGYAATIRRQIEMGELLRKKLTEKNWKILNQTLLPLVCFTDGDGSWDSDACQRVANAIVSSGYAWISTVKLGTQKQSGLRACITNYRTEPHHIDALVAMLDQLRNSERRKALAGHVQSSTPPKFEKVLKRKCKQILR